MAYESRGTAAPEQALSGLLVGQRAAVRELRYALYKRHVRRGARVVSMAGGAGQEIGPAKAVGASEFRLFDISQDSVKEASRRMTRTLQSAHVADCWAPDFLDVAARALGADPRGRFDAVCCNLALHYAWASPERASTAVRNAAAFLRPGGVFFGLVSDAEVALERREAACRGEWALSSDKGWCVRARFEAGGGYRFNLRDPGVRDQRTGRSWRLFMGEVPLEYGVHSEELKILADAAGLRSLRPHWAGALELLRPRTLLDPLNAEIVKTYAAFAFQKRI
jgi:SAM-dependent methyltransferase